MVISVMLVPDLRTYDNRARRLFSDSPHVHSIGMLAVRDPATVTLDVEC